MTPVDEIVTSFGMMFIVFFVVVVVSCYREIWDYFNCFNPIESQEC